MAGKKFRKVLESFDHTRRYTIDEACQILPRTKISTKWDETVDVSVRLGVNPKYADQMVRGSVVMPSGTGKTKRVLVIAKADKQKVKVTLSMFGRPTSVELDFAQVEKA